MVRWLNHRGQVATYFLVLLAVILSVAMVMVNVGYVAVTRTQTSNAADAGALAAASWVASTENALAAHSKAMARMYLAFQLAYAISFGAPFMTFGDAWRPAAKFAAFQLFNWLRAKIILSQGWRQAKEAAISYAFINAGIEAKKFPDWLRAQMKGRRFATRSTWTYPESLSDWDRNTEDAAKGQNTVTVIREFPDPPNVWPQPFVLVGLFWGPPFCPMVPCMVPWMRLSLRKAPEESLSWLQRWILDLPFPHFGIFCNCELPIPFALPTFSSLAATNDTGVLRVTVKHDTQDANLRLWQMVYHRQDDPERNVRSHAWAEYGGGRITGPGFISGFSMPEDTYDVQLRQTE